jgi:hypothetical protein
LTALVREVLIFRYNKEAATLEKLSAIDSHVAVSHHCEAVPTFFSS